VTAPELSHGDRRKRERGEREGEKEALRDRPSDTRPRRPVSNPLPLTVFCFRPHGEVLAKEEKRGKRNRLYPSPTARRPLPFLASPTSVLTICRKEGGKRRREKKEGVTSAEEGQEPLSVLPPATAAARRRRKKEKCTLCQAGRIGPAAPPTAMSATTPRRSGTGGREERKKSDRLRTVEDN